MLTSYLTTALRYLLRRPGYFAIDLIGLAAGLAACLLIALYVDDELSYDRFHANADRVYRVLREFDRPQGGGTISRTPLALAPAIDGVPGIEKAIVVLQDSPTVRRRDRELVEPAFLYSADGFFDLFSYPIARGDAELDRPGTVLISRSTAERYFPDRDPLGEIITVDDFDMEITGVLGDVPGNSHLELGFVAAIPVSLEAALEAESETSWSLNNFLTYVLLEEGASKERVTEAIARVIAASNTSPSEDGNNFVPHLQPLTGIHFGSGVPVEVRSDGDLVYVYLFAALAAFILVLACINFTNLATAHSSERAREVGVRKSLGARRRQLCWQFLGEALVTSTLALAIAMALVRLALPWFEALAGKSFALDALYGGPRAAALLGLVALVGVIAGAYPALMLSRFEPVVVLKGGPMRSGAGGRRCRQGLVVFQFAVSIALIAATAIVLEQFRYMSRARLGFDPQNLLVVEQAAYLEDRIEVFKQELAAVPGVESVTAGFSVPGTRLLNQMWRQDEPGAELHNLDYSLVDADYARTLGIELAAGRVPSPERAEDDRALLLNETAARDFGWSPAEAIGKQLVPPWEGGPYTVVGVARDFHAYSLHTGIRPIALVAPDGVPPIARLSPRYVAARVAPDDIARVIESTQALWRRFSDLPFQFSWLADDLGAQYGAEERLAKLFAGFSTLAILIACLGLFGLAAFAADRRRKEIGVRKVLGATRLKLLGQLSGEFLALVAVAFVIAAPVAYFAMQRWLERFAYRTDPGAGDLLLAGGLAVAIALLAVSSQVMRAARTHPAEALRHE